MLLFRHDAFITPLRFRRRHHAAADFRFSSFATAIIFASFHTPPLITPFFLFIFYAFDASIDFRCFFIRCCRRYDYATP